MKSAILVAATVAVGCVFAETHTVASIVTSADAALVVRPGDTIELPDGTYRIGNERLATLVGNTATILKPGILAIQSMSGDSVAAVLPVVSIPEVQKGGTVYIYRENAMSDGQHYWTRPESWSLPDGTTGGYPNKTNDVAMILRCADGWAHSILLETDVTVGQIYFSNVQDFSDCQEAYALRFCSCDSLPRKLTLCQTGDDPALFSLSPNMVTSGHAAYVQFGDNDKPLIFDCASDVDFDFGWDEVDQNKNLAHVNFSTYSTLNVADGKTLDFIGSAPHGVNEHWDIGLNGVATGSGTIKNAGREDMYVNFTDGSAFTGTICDAASFHSAGFDRDATTWFKWCDTLGNAALGVQGFCVRSNWNDWNSMFSAGYVRIGTDHFYSGVNSYVGNRLPGRELILEGGRVELRPEYRNDPASDCGWGDGKVLSNCTQVLNVKSGLSRIEVYGDTDTNRAAWPTNYVSFESLRHDDKGSLMIVDQSVQNPAGAHRCRTYIKDTGDEVVGGIIPWMTAQDGADWINQCFVGLDEDGRVVAAQTGDWTMGGGTADLNARVSGGFTIGADLEILNSLDIRQQWGGRFVCNVPEGKTLEIVSGGLIMSGGKADFGTPSTVGAGTLKFDRTAYVWSNMFDQNKTRDEGTMSSIYTKIVAPYGFVSAMYGSLLLAGDQTGIDDELVVNGGVLLLGSRDGAIGCTLDVPVRLAGGGSTLVITKVNGQTLDPKQNLYFDDAGGYAAKIEIPEGSVEKCNKCYVSGVTIPRGKWGATGSGADNIDDEHFSGSGMLVVKTDELAHPLVIKIR